MPRTDVVIFNLSPSMVYVIATPISSADVILPVPSSLNVNEYFATTPRTLCSPFHVPMIFFSGFAQAEKTVMTHNTTSTTEIIDKFHL